MRHPLRALGVAASACALALAAPAVAEAPQGGAFEVAVAEAKAAMMADPTRALSRAQAALPLAAEGPDEGVRAATAQWLQAEALIRLNRVGEAAPLLERAIAAVAARDPASTLHARLRMTEAGVRLERGDVAGGLSELQAARAIFVAVGDRRGEAMALQNLGSAYQDAGAYDAVLACYARAEAVYSADPALAVSAHNNRGNALRALARYDEAATELKAALAIGREMESPVLQARILTNLAADQMQAGDLAGADASLAQAGALADADPGAAKWRPFILGVAAEAAARRGQPGKAAQLLDRMFAGVALSETGPEFVDFHQVAAQAYAKVGRLVEAHAHAAAYARLHRPPQPQVAGGDACGPAQT